MKILYIDLGVTDFAEDYSISPRGYGGAPVFARFAKEKWNADGNVFKILAQPGNFFSLTKGENNEACIAMTWEALEKARSGFPIDLLYPEYSQYDVFMFHHDCMPIPVYNPRIKIVHWSLSGKSDAGHFSNHLELLYRADQKPEWVGQRIRNVTLGKPIKSEPPQKVAREKSIFQCSRHDEFMNSALIAKKCIESKLKGVFAGPIQKGCNLLEYIDNNSTFYIGSISEGIKLKYIEEVAATTYLHRWDTPFNQSAIESLGCGTPILCAEVGFFKTLVKPGSNGYFIDESSNISEFVDKCLNLNPKDCWETALDYSVDKMLDSFKKALDELMNEND